MRILVYEDNGYRNLFPVAMMRPVYFIRTGVSNVIGRIEDFTGNKYSRSLHCRSYMAGYIRSICKYKINEIEKDDYLLINGRAVINEEAMKHFIKGKGSNVVYVHDGEVIAAHVSKKYSSLLKSKVEGSDNIPDDEFFGNKIFGKEDVGRKAVVSIIRHPWDMISHLIENKLSDDYENIIYRQKNFSRIKKYDGCINAKRIFTGKETIIQPQCILDASEGDIFINDNAKIESFSYIKGPAYMGTGSLVKAGTKIYGPCVIGEFSKVAGEIAESILFAYVNKQHEGFLGHSYICPFVNLGADTVTSDLKNNYSNIRIKTDGKEFDTGMKFLGSIIGDHSKTSINTMLNTGSIIGIFANLFGGGFHDKIIDSFSWNECGKSSVRYDIDKAIETAKTVMSRRHMELTTQYEDLIRYYFQNLN